MAVLSRTNLREPIARVAVRFPDVIKVPAPIDRDLQLMIYPRYEELRYISHDKEVKVKEFLEDNLSEDDTCIDAGAHIGYYSLIAADITGASGTVVAFEPHPDNAERIRENARANNLDIVVNEAAITGQTGSASLKIAENSLSHSVSTGGGDDIKTWSLDEYIKINDLSPDVIKIDIEGEEGSAVQGMRTVLATHRPSVVIEIHPWIASEDAREIYETLKNHDYKIETSDQTLSVRDFIEIYDSPPIDQDHVHIFALPQ